MSQALTLLWSARSHSGSRKERNDDSWLAFASSPAGAKPLDPEGAHSLADHDLVFAISDGMGGAKAGDLASSLILEKMSQIIPETFKLGAQGFFPDCLDHLRGAIQSVHEHINQAATAECQGMAATVALAWFTLDNLYIANAGDSRIYRCRKGELEQLSKDHTLAWSDWKRGVISEIEYRNHPRRAALYQVVGGGHPGVSPHFAAIPYQPGDRFLICSDGLIDGIWERHIKIALTEEADPRSATQAMLNRALANSGIDDVTLLVIHIPDSAEGPQS